MPAITYRRLQPSFSVDTLSALCTTLALGAWLPNAHGQSGVLEEIRVTATLRADHAEQRSVTVFTPQLISARSAQHLEDLLSAAPNAHNAAFSAPPSLARSGGAHASCRRGAAAWVDLGSSCSG